MLFTILIILAIAATVYFARKSFVSSEPAQPVSEDDGDPKDGIDGIDRNDRR